MKTLVNHVYIRIWSSWLTFTVLQWMKTNIKISQFSRFLLRSEYASQVRISKWLKLLNSVPFVKKTLVNKVYIWIWSLWLTLTALQWMKINFKFSQFEDFCLGPGMQFWSKFLKWPKLLNSVTFIKKTFVNHVYIRIWASWLTFTVLYSEWRKSLKLVNLKISAKVEVCYLGQNFYNDQIFLILFHSSRKYLEMMFIFEFDHVAWLSQFYSEWRQASNLVNFQDFC